MEPIKTMRAVRAAFGTLRELEVHGGPVELLTRDELRVIARYGDHAQRRGAAHELARRADGRASRQGAV